MATLRNLLPILAIVCAAAGCGPSRGDSVQNAATEVMAERAQANPMIGKPAPIFEVSTLEKQPKKVKLSDYRGKVVLIDFWATWCGPCRALMPYVQGWHDAYAKQGLKVMAISNEQEEVIRRFKASRSETYPTYWDSNQEADTMFGIQALPTVAIIDRQGVVRWMGPPDTAAIEGTIVELLKES